MMSMVTEELAEAYHIQVEKYIKLHIRPKPKWLPKVIWKKLLKRFLILDEFKGVKNER